METLDVEVPQKPSLMPYIWAVVIMFLIASGLVLGILILRPAADPLVVTGGVFGVAATMTASIISVMKSQETHLSVNSRLDSWKRSMRAEARREGGDIERDRVAALPAAPLAVPVAVLAAVPAHAPTLDPDLPMRVVATKQDDEPKGPPYKT